MSDKSKVKPTSSLDVEVLLSEALGTTKIDSYVDIYKEKRKPVALVKPKKRLRGTMWSQINSKVKEWGGTWRRREQLWDVPLEART